MSGNWFSRLKATATARWRALRRRRPSVRHTAEAWRLLQERNGNQYAGAITYFSFLALFPLVLLAVAITGFVLHSHPAAQQSLFDHITAQVPGSFGSTLSDSIHTAIDARTGVGIIGLAGVLLTGLGWIGNLRAAVGAVWGSGPDKRNFFVAKAMNLLVLAGLGLGILISLGLTVLGTAATDQVLRLLSLDHVAGVHYLVKVFGLLLAVAGDFIIFSWLLVRLPGADVPGRIAWKGALLAAIGFEILKIVGTFTIAKSAGSPTAGPFAGLVAILIWIQLVARFMLFCAGWMAVLTAEQTAPVAPVDEPTADGPDRKLSPPMNPAALGVTLVGAGAVAGAAAATAVTVAVTSRRGHGRR
ncbi:MAG: YhjD/YihY/BrkB family envelope integrity protein [Jatrophihabitantaceae bacterium]